MSWSLHERERHLARVLADAGYISAAVGEVHECYPALPLDFSETDTGASDLLASRGGFGEVVLDGPEGPDGQVRASRAIERLERFAGSGEPFYLQLAFAEPHRLFGDRDQAGEWGFIGNHLQPDRELGVTVPPYLLADVGGQTELAEVQGAVRYVDRAIGRVLDRLRELDLAQDTIVVFTTDHGLSMPRAKMAL